MFGSKKISQESSFGTKPFGFTSNNTPFTNPIGTLGSVNQKDKKNNNQIGSMNAPNFGISSNFNNTSPSMNMNNPKQSKSSNIQLKSKGIAQSTQKSNSQDDQFNKMINLLQNRTTPVLADVQKILRTLDQQKQKLSVQIERHKGMLANPKDKIKALFNKIQDMLTKIQRRQQQLEEQIERYKPEDQQKLSEALKFYSDIQYKTFELIDSLSNNSLIDNLIKIQMEIDQVEDKIKQYEQTL